MLSSDTRPSVRLWRAAMNTDNSLQYLGWWSMWLPQLTTLKYIVFWHWAFYLLFCPWVSLLTCWILYLNSVFTLLGNFYLSSFPYGLLEKSLALFIFPHTSTSILSYPAPQFNLCCSISFSLPRPTAPWSCGCSKGNTSNSSFKANIFYTSLFWSTSLTPFFSTSLKSFIAAITFLFTEIFLLFPHIPFTMLC